MNLHNKRVLHIPGFRVWENRGIFRRVHRSGWAEAEVEDETPPRQCAGCSRSFFFWVGQSWVWSGPLGMGQNEFLPNPISLRPRYLSFVLFLLFFPNKTSLNQLSKYKKGKTNILNRN